MNLGRAQRALAIVAGYVVHAADDQARADAEHVLDVLRSIETQPPPRCLRGPERCYGVCCWPDGPAA